jgi:lactoylglutathione lyase
MRVEHIALWTHDIDRLRTFYERYFEAQASPLYRSRTRADFTSCFLQFPSGGARLELMSTGDLASAPRGPAVGYTHVALAVGSEAAVDALTARLQADGVRILGAPRRTGDGYYESVIADPDGNTVEITV